MTILRGGPVSEYSERFYKVINLAACTGVPKDWFYPPSQMDEDDRELTSRSRAICEQCPIKQQCHDHAIRHEEFGFWAGLSPKQRRAIRRAQRIPFESFTTQAAVWNINWMQPAARNGKRAKADEKKTNA